MNKRVASGAQITGSIATVWSKVAHDLRQPIQSLMLLTHVMALTEPADDRLKTQRSMEESLLSLQAMLDTLTSIARLETGVDVPRAANLDLFAMASAALQQSVGDGATHTNEIPLAGTSMGITADKKLAGVLISGVLQVAIKYAQKRHVHAATRSRNGQALLEIVFQAAALTQAQQSATFIEIGYRNKVATISHTAAGVGLLTLIAGHAGASLEIGSLSHEEQSIAIVFPQRTPAPKPTHE